MFGQIEFDVVSTVPFNFYTKAVDVGAATVVKFQPNGSMALFDYDPAVLSWVETSPGLWTASEPLTLSVETFADRRNVYVDGTLVLSGVKDGFVQGVGIHYFFFRYGNVSGDSSATFGPGSLTMDNVLVTTIAPDPVPAVGDVGLGVMIVLLLAIGASVINRGQQQAT